jgi:peptidoglycan/LPS O-acetylase OafA/YrhL
VDVDGAGQPVAGGGNDVAVAPPEDDRSDEPPGDVEVGVLDEPPVVAEDVPAELAAGASLPVKPRHFPCFDGLRAIAAVSVLALHTAWSSGFTMRSSLGIYTSRLEIGVSVFFLISGFLLYRPFVASHLSGRPDPSIGRFWVRRVLRIVPAYWLALTVLTYGLHVVSMGRGWQGIIAHYLFLQIYIPAESFNGIGQAWSLCTEVSFYVFLPLYAWLVGFRRSASPTRRLWRELLGEVVLVAVSFGFRWWELHIPYFTVRDGKFVALCAPHCLTAPLLSSLMIDWLPALLDLFALGMFLATMSSWFFERGNEPSWLRSRWMPWVSWLCAGVTYWGVSHLGIPKTILYLTSPVVSLERQTLYGVFAFFLLLPAVFGPQDQGLVRRLLQTWPMVSLGVISYGIYIWHLDLITDFIKWTGYNDLTAATMPYWQMFLGVLALAVAFSTVSYFGLERPILRWKDRIGWWDRSGRRQGPGAPREPGAIPGPVPTSEARGAAEAGASAPSP